MPASGQGGRILMAFQGILCIIPPCFAGGSRSPPSPASIFLAGDFLYTKFCVQTRVKPPPLGFSARFGLNRRQRRRSERRKARARPPCADAGGRNIPHRRTRPTRRRGRPPRRRAREGAHGAASGARTAGRPGGQTAHARRPRTQPRRGPRPQLSRPASGRTGAQLFFAPLTEIDRIAARQRHGEKRGVVRGEKNTAGAAAKNAPAEPTPDQTPEQPPTTAPGGAPRARNRAGSRTTARRGDAKQSAASGQAAQADDGRDGQRARKPPHPAPRHSTEREPRQRTAKRRRDGRRRRRPGGNRTREPSRRPKATSAEKRRNRTPQHARDRPRRPRTTAATGGSTHARRAGAPCANAQTASEQRAQRANARKAGGRAKARTRPPREAAGAAARPPPSQTPRAARTQRAARPIVARRCGHFRAGGMRGTLPSAFPLPSLVRFRGMGGVIAPQMQKNAQKGEKTRIWGLRGVEPCAILCLRCRTTTGRSGEHDLH